MRYVTRPLTPESRARLKDQRRQWSSPFSSAWSSTLELLDRELRHLGVRDEFVLQIDCTEADLRLDGQLRANARPASPAVAIAVETRDKGSLLFVCGRFSDWRDNVRAIALGLEALRKVDRYGITQSNEQYRGWQALPPGTPMPPAQMTAEQAAARLAVLAGFDGSGAAALVLAEPDRYYRYGAKRCHPDAPSGSTELFQELEECYRLVKAAA
jgi:hypothetical protein